ncbi:MAG: PIN domain-containing protein [Nitrososphaerales archaeon]
MTGHACARTAKEAARLRCRHSNLPSADGIIAATAIISGSVSVVTDDPHIKRMKENKDMEWV